MNAITRTLILLVVLLTVKSSTGQLPFIDSVKVFPARPTKNDSIWITLHVSTPSPSKTLYISHSLVNGNILISACYNSNNTAAQADTLSDTLGIGKLPEGNYELNVTAYYNQFFSNPYCDNIQDSSTRIDSFVVQAPQNIALSAVPNISVHPNPVQNQIKLEIAKAIIIQKIQLIDIQQRLLTNYSANSRVFDLSLIPAGMYFLRIETNNGIYIRRLSKE